MSTPSPATLPRTLGTFQLWGIALGLAAGDGYFATTRARRTAAAATIAA